MGVLIEPGDVFFQGAAPRRRRPPVRRRRCRRGRRRVRLHRPVLRHPSAREHGIKATVLEANTVAWGCSTRNGGQAQISSGRLKRSEWIERWGVDVARKMHAEVCEASSCSAI